MGWSRRGVVGGAWFVLALACGGGGAPAPEVAPPTVPDVEPTPAPEPVQLSTPGALLAWQEPFARRPERDVRDYLMLMPDDLFHCDAMELRAYDEAARDGKITVRHVENGYLEVSTGVGRTQIALFKDRKNHRDVVARVTNCGAGCMCNETSFAVFGEDHRFAEVDVLPVAEIEAALADDDRADLGWWPDLPIQGTTTAIVGEDGTKLLELTWSDGAFVLAP